jgi:hypothetical protein
MSNVDVNNLNLKLGQKVKTNIKFYSNCEGKITGFHPYYDRNKGIVDYKIDFYCLYSDPRLSFWINDVFLPENVLITEDK